MKPRRISSEKRKSIVKLLAEGHDRATIAAKVGVTLGQVSAIAAHVTMGTYDGTPKDISATDSVASERASDMIDMAITAQPKNITSPKITTELSGIYLGDDVRSSEAVFWNPDPDAGAANPHTLVVGESGFGKTYAVTSLLTELKRCGVLSLVFDYGQGFTRDAAPKEFVEWAAPIEYPVNREGIDVNPFRIFPSDTLGPINVAQRVADTFSRFYTKLGVQQHAVLRQAVIDVFADHGMTAGSPGTWTKAPPAFVSLRDKLDELAADGGANSKLAATVSSHISTMFVYNTFRPGGQKLDWGHMLAGDAQVVVLQLKGLEHSLERVVTEFLLWNLIGFVESLGPSPIRCFIVLDEAHRLSFDTGSPVEKLLREGRKFGLGVILASQQPDDFSPVAFANTATKMVFQTTDDSYVVSRQLQRKLRNTDELGDVASLITKLPRGTALFVSENSGRVVRIATFKEREGRWQ